MYVNSTLRALLALGGAALLAVVALVAWSPKTGSRPEPAAPAALGSAGTAPEGAGQDSAANSPAPMNAYGEPVTPPGERIRPIESATQVAPSAGLVQPVVLRRRSAARRNSYRRRRRIVVIRRRPFRRSAAIVAGSAAGGALIGGLAGGGKGAGIGAVAGGAGGLVYDRLTHKKRRVVVRR